jgi:hypothetical protein
MNYLSTALGLVAGMSALVDSSLAGKIEDGKWPGSPATLTEGILARLALKSGAEAEEVVTGFLTAGLGSLRASPSLPRLSQEPGYP